MPVTIVTAAYLLFVLKIGPALMKDRKPLNLRNVLIVYNLLQVVASMYIVIKVIIMFFCSSIQIALHGTFYNVVNKLVRSRMKRKRETSKCRTSCFNILATRLT